jgi:hypothetical protein
MNAARDALLGWTGCLLDRTRSPGEQRDAAHAWCAWAMQRLGLDDNCIDPPNDPLNHPISLPTGEAISPQSAAFCVRDHRRTAVFLQAMDAAIRAARIQFPGETIHVVEAGCGPLAPLTLPFALRHAPEEVSFTLIDLHETSLAGARQLAAEFGVTPSFRACVAGDAGAVKFAEDQRPHVIACEVLRRALAKEPQVAVTRALAPQLRAGGFFLPERIDVDLGLLHWDRHLRRMTMGEDPLAPNPIEELGSAFVLDAYAAAGLVPSAEGLLRGGVVALPPHEPGQPRLFTRIKVFRKHVLRDFESGLTLPEPLGRRDVIPASGGTVQFTYEISANPGLRATVLPSPGVGH